MAHLRFPTISAVGCAVVLLLGSTVHAQPFVGSMPEMQARLDALSHELAEQRRLLADLETFRQQYLEQRGLLQSLERQVAQQQVALDELRGSVGWNVLASQRGAGTAGEPLRLARHSRRSPCRLDSLR